MSVLQKSFWECTYFALSLNVCSSGHKMYSLENLPQIPFIIFHLLLLLLLNQVYFCLESHNPFSVLPFPWGKQWAHRTVQGLNCCSTGKIRESDPPEMCPQKANQYSAWQTETLRVVPYLSCVSLEIKCKSCFAIETSIGQTYVSLKEKLSGPMDVAFPGTFGKYWTSFSPVLISLNMSAFSHFSSLFIICFGD